MDDYSALAQRIAVSIREVRGCLILSRDGMVLGAYPAEEEATAKSAWLRFCVLGEPERSFVEFAEQTWAFVKRGPYAAFAVAEAGVRPGIMVDQLEQILLTAEDGRIKRETVHLPDASTAPSGKPRTSLHPSSGKPEPAESPADQRKWSKSMPQMAGAQAETAPGPVAASGADPAAPAAPPVAPPPAAPPPAAAPAPPQKPSPTPVQAQEKAAEPPATKGRTEPAIAAAAAAIKRPASTVDPKGPEGPVTALKKQPQKLVTSEAEASEDGDEIDPVMLAREFSRLLQMNGDDDEGSS